MWFSWREVAIHDVGGALLGAVFASSATCASGAVMVGTSMSVASGVRQVLSHVFSE